MLFPRNMRCEADKDIDNKEELLNIENDLEWYIGKREWSMATSAFASTTRATAPRATTTRTISR
jgi:hypothetical protein